MQDAHCKRVLMRKNFRVGDLVKKPTEDGDEIIEGPVNALVRHAELANRPYQIGSASSSERSWDRSAVFTLVDVTDGS